MKNERQMPSSWLFLLPLLVVLLVISCTNKNVKNDAERQKTNAMKQVIISERAPRAIGPYSQAVAHGDLIFVSGQIPIDPKTGQLVKGDIVQSFDVIIKNIKEILSAANSSLDKVLKVTIYMNDLAYFAQINEEYARYFKEPYPAREVIEVSALPKEADLEISVIATH